MRKRVKTDSGKAKYGALSRKERDYINEYGSRPSELAEEQETDAVIDAITEEEFDRRRKQTKTSDAAPFPSDALDEMSQVPAYQRLLNSLQATKNEVADYSDFEPDSDGQDPCSETEILSGKNGPDDDQDSIANDVYLSDDEHEVLAAEEESIYDPYPRHFDRPVLTQIDATFTSATIEDADLGQVVMSTGVPYHIKEMKTTSHKLKNRIREACADMQLPSAQAKVLDMFSEYHDVLLTDQKYETMSDRLTLYAIHSLNHVYKTRDRILKNSEKLKRADESSAVEYRDQGFTRPKVLVLLPFKSMALKFVNMLINLSGTLQQENKKRFIKEFSTDPDDDNMDTRKPIDYQQTFEGNIDDCFRVGIKLSRKSMKLYADFYGSDIIVASPLGLRMIIGSKGDKKRDFDFLSSMEVVIADSVDTLFTQNWDHLKHVFEHLNLIPKEFHDADFSRVRPWYLDGQAKYLRQTIMSTAYVFPELNTLWKKYCSNVVGGKIRTKQSYDGSIGQVVSQIEHIFQKVQVTQIAELDNSRFKYFTETAIPTLKASSSFLSSSQTCIVIPSYFDFLRVKNWFKQQELSFAAISEYTPSSDISRARSEFFHGRATFLLVTERYHFYRRYNLRGIHRLILYAPLMNARFYSEFANMLDGDTASVMVLYTIYDALSLERIVGTKRVARMIQSDKSLFMFA